MTDIDRKVKSLEDRVRELEAYLDAIKSCVACVELDGFDEQYIYGTGVPPVGATFTAHKHTTDGGTYATFEVTGHCWELTDTVDCPDQGNRTMFAVRVKTRRCD